MNSSLRRAISIVGLLLLQPGAGACIQDDEGQEASGSEQVLADLGADLRVAVFAEVLPKDEAYAIWETAEEALTSDNWEVEEVSESEVGDREALGILGGALKDAIANGQMSEEEALEIWNQMTADVERFYREHEDADGGKPTPGAWQRSLHQSGGMLITRLRAPNPGRIRILLRPEFLQRDAAYLRSELQLEKSIATIIVTILEDYIDAYSARVDAFRKALRQSRRRGSLEKVDSTLARMQGIRLDRERAAERIGIIQDAEKRQYMFDALDNFENNLGKVRIALQAKRAVILEDGDVPNRATIHRMFTEFNSYRDQQRRLVVEEIEAVLQPEKIAQFQWLLDQIRLEKARNLSTFGGMDVDISLALEEAFDDVVPSQEINKEVGKLIPMISATAKSWTDAMIRRERKGLELDTAQLQSDEAHIGSALQAYIGSLSSELSASVNLRNVIQNAVSQLTDTLQVSAPKVAHRFSMITQQHGFAAQVRQRWCQKALVVALKIENLEDEILIELLEVQEYLAPQLEVMRAQAIQQRLQEEPRVARGSIEAMSNQETSRALSMNAFMEPNHVEFNRLDEQVQRQLLALLSDEQFKSLPRRPGAPLSKDDGKDWSDKDGGKETPKDAGKGKGAGRGKGEGRGKD